MKIIFLGRYNQTEILTGPEKVAKRIFAEFTKREPAVFAEYFFDGTKYGILKKLFGKEKIQDVNGSPVVRMGLFQLLKLLFSSKPGIIHIITYERFTVVAFLYKLFRKVRIFYNVHGIIIHENTKYKSVPAAYFYKDIFCEKIFMKYSDRLIFLSDESLKIASTYYKINSSKISILPNGIDEIFHVKGEEKVYSTDVVLKIAFTGSIERKEKGFAFLDGALSKVSFVFQLYLAGNSELSDKENYIFVPFKDTDSYAEFICGMDVFISASEYEPFSISTAEAMAAGVLPVVTKETGMSEYVQNNVNGFVFNFGATDELGKILEKIHSDRSLIQRYSQKAKDIYEVLNWSNVCSLYKNLYESETNS
ncbi:MAG: glycosyltransferase family 4 protein [Ignavibacteria bacterium]